MMIESKLIASHLRLQRVNWKQSGSNENLAIDGNNSKRYKNYSWVNKHKWEDKNISSTYATSSKRFL